MEALIGEKMRKIMSLTRLFLMSMILTILVLTLTTSLANSESPTKVIKFTEDNHCFLDSSVSAKSMGAMKICLSKKHLKRGKKSYPIYLVINSPGGSVYAGLDFIRFAKNIPNLKTYTIFAASMASAIVEHLPGDRIGSDFTVTMFHRAKGSFKGQFEDGEVEKQLKLWKEIVRSMETASSKRIGISLEEYKKRVKDEWWVYGDDNVTQNTLDSITPAKCSNKLLKKFTSKTVDTLFFGKVTISKSKCPLIGQF